MIIDFLKIHYWTITKQTLKSTHLSLVVLEHKHDEWQTLQIYFKQMLYSIHDIATYLCIFTITMAEKFIDSVFGLLYSTATNQRT